LPGLVIVGGLIIVFCGGRWGRVATADVQVGDIVEGRIMVVPMQLGKESYGLAMVDTQSQTLWIYEINSRAVAHNRLRLLAARSWKYDRLLTHYNTAEPKPEQVRALLDRLSRKPQEPVKEEKEAEEQEQFDVNNLKLLE